MLRNKKQRLSTGEAGKKRKTTKALDKSAIRELWAKDRAVPIGT